MTIPMDHQMLNALRATVDQNAQIITELQALNKQIAWQNEALTRVLAERDKEG